MEKYCDIISKQNEKEKQGSKLNTRLVIGCQQKRF